MEVDAFGCALDGSFEAVPLVYRALGELVDGFDGAGWTVDLAAVGE
jgi:hypothetical protein